MTNRIVNVLTFSILTTFSIAISAEQAPVTVKLSQVTGNVMVNDGTRFVKASSGIQVKPGTKVIASKDSTLDLIYQNGCVKQVKANTMLTVGTQAECVAKISDERIYVAAVGNGRGIGSQNRFLSNPLVIAGVVATAIAVPVVLVNSDSSNNNNNTPVSP